MALAAHLPELAAAFARPRIIVLRDPRHPAGDDALPFAELGCEVVETPVDRGVIDRLQHARPSVIVVDLDGGHFELLRLCRSIRSVSTAWLVVTSTDDVDDRLIVEALDAGADDLIARASPAVVAARVRVGLRARPARPEPPTAINIGDVVIDERAHELRIADEPVRCPPVQFALFLTLARQLGTVVRSEELLRSVWGAAGELHPRRLRIAVSAARHILGSSPNRPRLETVTKIGYRMVAPVSV